MYFDRAMTMDVQFEEDQEARRQLGWLLGGVGVGALDDVGWIRVTGEDRVRWLNGMVTNSIQELKSGEGNYSFVLNAQGRVQGDLTAFAEDDALLLRTGRERVGAMMAMLDRYIIMDDVVLEDVSAGRVGVGVSGPVAAALLSRAGLSTGAAGTRVKVAWRGGVEVEVISAWGPLVPRIELWSDAEAADGVRTVLTAAAVAEGGGAVGGAALEWLRMLEGTPLYGRDLRDRELPQETGQGRALHFAKGCYLGQEIVERIRSRGNVHRAFGAFRLDGPMPEAGTALEVDGKAAGELTSVAAIPVGEGVLQLGLGYARREALERGSVFAYARPDGFGTASPVPLPVRGADGPGLASDMGLKESEHG